MFRVRTVHDVDDFTGAPGDPVGYADSVRNLWETGASSPDWCFVLESEGDRIGRIGFRVQPTVSDPAWRGSLPPNELFAFGLHLPWEGEFLDAGRHLLAHGAAAIAGQVPDVLEVRINNDVHPHPAARCRLMEHCGLELFQEKFGYTWTDDGWRPRDEDRRLSFLSIAAVGADTYRAVMAPCGEGTLDRNDRYYWQGCGPDNWAAQMLDYFDEGDAPMWLVGYRDDTPVGYIAVSAVDDWGSTIAHVGVLPAHRGSGYIDDLLDAGTLAAREMEITTMLSDVDVRNEPMRQAMRKAGHRENPDRWHVWVYRGMVPDL